VEPFTSQDVQTALDAFDLGLRVQFFEQSTATSQEAATATGVELGQIVKSIAFLVDKKPVLVLASGDQRVDTRKLAALRGVGHKKVKIARPEQCVEFFGYAPGGVPPVGHRTPPAQIYIEDSLTRYTGVYAAAGAPNAVFPLTLDQLRQITGGEVADLKVEG
jgi:prolyl-tRNA editing enzyme YbaK/EbsC (Cys-tRNA(Pro) deacylase)